MNRKLLLLSDNKFRGPLKQQVEDVPFRDLHGNGDNGNTAVTADLPQ